MTDGELRDELVTLLLAGHETTATSVAWAIERLVRHPDKLARLVAEIDAGATASEYMTAVVNETLRVRPVVPIVARMLQRGASRSAGTLLPAGTRVVPSIYLTNRNPRVYDAPGEFRPERFLDDAPETFSWIPFGGGIRRCIGASFAQLEMKLMLRTMLARARSRACPARGCRCAARRAAPAPRDTLDPAPARSRSCRRAARAWSWRERSARRRARARQPQRVVSAAAWQPKRVVTSDDGCDVDDARAAARALRPATPSGRDSARRCRRRSTAATASS